MSTRSRIGIQLKDGSIRSAYHHWDGYPEWLGVKLKTHYDTKELVTKLIRGGDMSSCWTQERWTKDGGHKNVSEYGAQYYSGRGEKTPSVKDKNLEDFLNRVDDSWAEYAYVFVNDEWVCYADGKVVNIPEPKVAVAA